MTASRGERSGAGLVDPVAQPQQALSGVVDGLRAAELDLERRPAPVGVLDDGVGFEVVAVAVVRQGTAVGLGVHQQVPQHQRLEEPPREGEIGQKVLSADAERCGG